MSDNSVESEPSDFLPWNLLWRANIYWDKFGNFFAVPARIVGVEIRNRVCRRLLVGAVLVVLAVPALVSVSWVHGIEPIRLKLIDDLPAAIASFLLSPLLSASLVSLIILLILSINRAWSINEVDREIRVYRGTTLKAADEPADLRYDGLVTALILLPTVPLWLATFNQASCKLATRCFYSNATSYLMWAMYTLRAWVQSLAPFQLNWSSSNDIVAMNPVANLLNTFVCYLISGVVIFSAFEWYRLSRVSAYAIDALERTPDRVQAIGSRIIPQLRWLFTADRDQHFSETFYKNAATALGAISSENGLDVLKRMTSDVRVRVRNRAVKGIDAMLGELSDRERITALEFLEKLDQDETADWVKKSIKTAVERHSPRPDLRSVETPGS